MSHIFTISTDPATGADIATCGDATVRSSRASAAHKLSRLMVTAGIADAPIEARGLDGRPRYAVRSLHAFARFDIAEEPRPRRWVWAEHPNATARKGRSGPFSDAPATYLADNTENPSTVPPTARKAHVPLEAPEETV